MFRTAARSVLNAARVGRVSASAAARSVATDAAAAASTKGYYTYLRAGAAVGAATAAAAALAIPAQWSPAECAVSVPLHGKPGTPYERTFLMVKPDGVARGLIHDIIRRWEQRGFTLVGIKILYPDRKLAEAHYADLSARPFFADLVNYMSTSGPVVAMVWQGKDVIKTSRVMIGTTNPLVSPPGTVRADLAVNVGRNVIHGSDGPEGAMSEIPLWFKPGEVIDIDSTQWPHHLGLYLYDTKQA